MNKKKIVVPAIPRQKILNEIDHDLRMVKQWSHQFAQDRVNTGYSSNAFGYMHRAEGLICLLEAFDSGSVGGFDEGCDGLYSLQERYEYLNNKYPNKGNK